MEECRVNNCWICAERARNIPTETSNQTTNRLITYNDTRVYYISTPRTTNDAFYSYFGFRSNTTTEVDAGLLTLDRSIEDLPDEDF